MNKKKWYDYLWIFSTVYLILGFFNILFAWLGLICFVTPLAINTVDAGNCFLCLAEDSVYLEKKICQDGWYRLGFDMEYIFSLFWGRTKTGRDIILDI